MQAVIAVPQVNWRYKSSGKDVAGYKHGVYRVACLQGILPTNKGSVKHASLQPGAAPGTAVPGFD